jgi:hypothetical protein
VAANGDQLVLQYYGPIQAPIAGEHEFTAVYETTFSGDESTGRFEGAEGEGTAIVHFTFDDFFDEIWIGEFSLTGSIDY